MGHKGITIRETRRMGHTGTAKQTCKTGHTDILNIFPTCMMGQTDMMGQIYERNVT